ncbi:DUF4249 domain-containing protein [Bacteroidota bacterium]
MQSCYEDLIDVDFNQFGSNIIIEGSITDQIEPFSVKITKTAPINGGGMPAPVTGANVIITDNFGNTFPLLESSAGYYYSSPIEGVTGRTYLLDIAAEGQLFTASSTLPEAIELDSVAIRIYFYNDGFFLDLTCYLTDKPEIREYCLLRFKINGAYQWGNEILYHDAFTDGQAVILDNIGLFCSPGDLLEIEVFTLDEAGYEFYSSLLNIEDYLEPEMPDFYEIVSSNPRSNISGGALGYFGTYGYRVYLYHL